MCWRQIRNRQNKKEWFFPNYQRIQETNYLFKRLKTQTLLVAKLVRYIVKSPLHVFSRKSDSPPPKITCSTLKLPLLVLSQTGFLRNIFSCCTNAEGGVCLQLLIYSLIQVSKVWRKQSTIVLLFIHVSWGLDRL